MFTAGGLSETKTKPQRNMNAQNPEPYGRDLVLRFEEERSYLALREIYLEAGLSLEDAQKSAAADLENFFECLTPCAA